MPHLTTKDLEDIKKTIEDENEGVTISWITTEDEEKEQRAAEAGNNFHHSQIVNQEIVHIDNGKGKTLQEIAPLEKWLYNVVSVHNANPKIALENVCMELHYQHGFMQENALSYYNFPPPVDKPSEYTVKKSRKWIDKNLKTLEDFRKFRFQNDAEQIIENIEPDKRLKPVNKVTQEIIKVAKVLKPKQTRYVILHSWGWSNYVTVRADYGIPGEKQQDA